jgi:hypothetical protein
MFVVGLSRVALRGRDDGYQISGGMALEKESQASNSQKLAQL